MRNVPCDFKLHLMKCNFLKLRTKQKWQLKKALSHTLYIAVVS